MRFLRRFTVVAIAGAILFLRTPTTFTNPQFFGEDAIFFFHAKVDGWPVMALFIGGYLSFAQGAVGFLVSFLDPRFAPAAYAYIAIALTLFVVWLSTSPRLEMPHRSLMAFAIVVVPMGWEELGSLCDIQWILPIGAFAIMFMHAPRSMPVKIGEILFVGLVSLTGPFSVFLAPLYVARAHFADPPNKFRLVVLAAFMTFGGLVQAIFIITHPATVDPFPSSPTLWITIPLNQIATTFGIYTRPLSGIWGASLGVCIIASAALLSLVRPYRMQKLFLLTFGLSIAFGGLYKFHDALASQENTERYFYMGSVFALWFLCCLSTHRYFRPLAFVVAVIEILTLPFVANKPIVAEDFEWRAWARYIDSGIQVLIPTTPFGWSVGFSATSTGPLAKFAPWIGKPIGDVVEIDPSACQGNIGSVIDRPKGPLTASFSIDQDVVWSISGTAVASGDRPIQLVAITDTIGMVVGFGFPGFKDAGWKSLLLVKSGNVRAFGIVDGRACPFTVKG